jgi:cytochrome b561
MNIAPRMPDQMPSIQRMAARAVHWAFYALMILVPLTGWLMSSAAGLSVSFFGWFVLPDMIHANREVMKQFEDIHGWLAYTLLAVIGLHVAAALKHHFIDKDNILRRMIS